MAFPRSGTVDTQTFSGTKDLVMARVSSGGQTTNIAANDHIKFDVIEFSRPDVSASGASGSSVTMDVTSSYSNTNGAASIGRVSLRGGRVYKLTCSPGYVLFSGATGLLTLQFVDVTSGASGVGAAFSVYAQTDATADGSGGMLQAFYNAPGSYQDVALLEVRFITVTALTSIGTSTKGLPTLLVETY